MTVQDLITSALYDMAVTAPGETASVSDLEFGLQKLQSMLRGWASKKINIYSTVDETINITGGTSSYSWGSGGTITTTRPSEIVSAYVRDNDTDFGIDVIDKISYDSITSKSITGIPKYAFLKPSFPLAYLYIYPVPDKAYVMYINTIKPFTETSSFNDLSDTFNFPPNYEEAVIANLYIRMASAFGKSVPAEIAAIAETSYNALVNLNANSQVTPVRFNLPLSQQSGYNINRGY